jgi:predicted nucleic acid-binding protein
VNGYLVDTSIPSELTRRTPTAVVADFLRKTDKNRLYLSVMTVGEICKGIDLLPVSQKRSDLQDWLDVEVHSWFAEPNPPGERGHCRALGPSGCRRS